MQTPMQYVQKKFGVRRAFVFAPDRLMHTVADYSGATEFPVAYEEIDFNNLSRTTLNNGRFYKLIFGLFLGLVSIGLLASGTEFKAVAGLLILLGAVGAVGILVANFLKLFAITYTILPIPSRGPALSLRIIRDRQHDIILEEIRIRRIARLRALYGQVDFANDPTAELRKFRALRDGKVITDDEYNDAASRIQAAQFSAGGRA